MKKKRSVSNRVIDWWLSIYKEGKSRPYTTGYGREKVPEYNAPTGKRLKATILIFVTFVLAVALFLGVLSLMIAVFGLGGFFLLWGIGLSMFFIYSCVLDKY